MSLILLFMLVQIHGAFLCILSFEEWVYGESLHIQFLCACASAWNTTCLRPLHCQLNSYFEVFVFFLKNPQSCQLLRTWIALLCTITEIISNGLETGKSKIMHWQIQHLVKASWFIGGHFLTLSHIIEGQWSSLLGLFYKGTTLSTKVYIVKTIVFPVVMLSYSVMSNSLWAP